MSTTTTSPFVERLIENRLLASAVSLAILIAGIVTVSAPLLILSGVIAYGWPFLGIYLLNKEEATKTARKTARPTTLRANTAAAH